MAELILIRHGQSYWNLSNRFTGWVDVPLSAKGVEEAHAAGKKISQLPVDRAFTSTLIRAQMTLCLALLHHHSQKVPIFLHTEKKQQEWGTIYGAQSPQDMIPVVQAWELNERMYGELQGLNKDETRAQFGKEQVEIWRRSFDIPPPNGESLEMTARRTLPYFEQVILPRLVQGENVLVVAHGNSLRSIRMELEGLTPEQVVNLELKTGDPVRYTFTNGSFRKHL